VGGGGGGGGGGGRCGEGVGAQHAAQQQQDGLEDAPG
jgi:hypothetical protein